MKYRLTNNTKHSLRGDNDLMSEVATTLGVKVSTLPAMLTRDHRRLTDIAVLKVISKKLKVKTDNLIEVNTEVVAGTK